MIKLTKLLYTVKECATLLSMSEPVIYKLVNDGELTAHCHNGPRSKPMRIVAGSISAYLEKWTVAAEVWRE